MTPLQHFQVLHELGHSTRAAMTLSSTSGLPVSIAQGSALALIAFMVSRSEWAVALITVYFIAMSVCVLATYLAKSTRWLSDELLADYYSLRHCRSDWFSRYEPRKLASLLASEIPQRLPSSLVIEILSILGIKIFLSEESQRRYRRMFLSRNLARIRKGKPPLDPYSPRWMQRAPRLADRSGYFVSGAALSLGYFFTAGAESHVLAFSIATGVVLFVSVVINALSERVGEGIISILLARHGA